MQPHAGCSRGRGLLGILLVLLLFAAPALAQTPTSEVLHYWAFNAGSTAPEAWPPPIPADLGTGLLDHDLKVELTGHAAFAGSVLNAQPGFPAGNSFVAQGSHNNGSALVLHIPTSGYERISLSYATQRTASGFTSHTFAYSVDGGATYTDVTTVTDLPTAYVVRTVDLSGIPEVNDAAGLRVRLTLDGATNAQANSRFDNLTVAGTPMPPSPGHLQIIHARPGTAEVDLYVGPASEEAAALVAGGAIATGAAFGMATAFAEVPAGRLRVVATAAGSPVTLLDQTLDIPSGRSVQALLVGDAQGGAALLVSEGAQRRAKGDDSLAVNTVHADPEAPAALARVEGTAGDSLRYGEFGPYAALAAGRLRLILTPLEGGEAAYTGDLSGLAEQGVTLVVTGGGAIAVSADGTVVPLAREVSLAGARALPQGSFVATEGVVARVGGGRIYAQDGTAALAVRFGASYPQASALTPGTRLRMTGRTAWAGSLLELTPDSLGVEALGLGEAPEPVEVTLGEVAGEGARYAGRLVRVGGLSMAVRGTFAADSSYAVADGPPGGELTLWVPEGSGLVGAHIPARTFSFTGVVGTCAEGSGYHLLGLLARDVEAEPVPMASVQFIHNAPGAALATADVYVDGERVLEGFAFRNATAYLEVPTEMTVAVALAGSASEEDAVYTKAFSLAVGARYRIIILGDAEGDGGSLALVGSQAQVTEAEVDLTFLHGVPDAPVVDLLARGVGEENSAVEAARFGEAVRLGAAAAGAYTFEVAVAGAPRPAAFAADFSEEAGRTVALLTSGYAVPGEGGASLGLLVVFEDGRTTLLEPGAETGQVSAEPGAGTSAFRVGGAYPNPLTTSTSLRVDLPTAAEVRVEVYDALGRRILATAPVQATPGAGHVLGLDASLLSAGTYVWRVVAETASGALTQTGRMTVVR